MYMFSLKVLQKFNILHKIKKISLLTNGYFCNMKSVTQDRARAGPKVTAASAALVCDGHWSPLAPACLVSV